jgi:3-oxoadipate enol-lactonase
VTVESGVAQVNGTSLYYELGGSGEPIVLLHGLGLDRRMWDPQIGSFEEQYRVLRYDLRGFGRSATPGSASYSHPKDLKSLLDHLGISHAAAVIGLSLGGSVALGSVLEYPAIARDLILVDSALGGYHWSSEWMARMNAIGQKAESAGPAAANHMWLTHPLFAPARANPKVRELLARMVLEYSGWHWVNDDPHVQKEAPDLALLGGVKPRTLVMVGERDLPDFRSMATILQEKIPGARFSMIRGVGHMVNLEAPEEFNKVVLRFLENQPTQ